MATRPRTHDAYTIGWVCALSKKQTAATAMLDERHQDLPKPTNDPNTYTFGLIGGHNIVIACLPEGKIGTNPAAVVASHMWDMGKAEHGGKFRRIGALNNPPTSLRTALAKLKTDHELEGSKISQYLEELQVRYPRLAKKYLRSDFLQDVLFKASYGHIEKQDQDASKEGEDGLEDDTEEDC
ncbi:hypothetical protein E8E14_000430 [Neopestalotiopsis sp. 37M]|nr:hypothetical protein E8E14_000430 [Neopestalotiopsis sp. 37M]